MSGTPTSPPGGLGARRRPPARSLVCCHGRRLARRHDQLRERRDRPDARHLGRRPVVGTSIIDSADPHELGRAIESLTAIAVSPDVHNFPMVLHLRLAADGRDIEVHVLAKPPRRRSGGARACSSTRSRAGRTAPGHVDPICCLLPRDSTTPSAPPLVRPPAWGAAVTARARRGWVGPGRSGHRHRQRAAPRADGRRTARGDPHARRRRLGMDPFGC